MWPFKKKSPSPADLPAPMVAAVLVSVFALAVSLGVARWSWLLLDEQIRMRKEFKQMRSDLEQTNTQYEYWLGKVQEERAAQK
jgi:hypothetical protein